MKRVNTTVEGEQVLVRKYKSTDTEDLYRNIRSKEISRWTIGLPYPYPKETAAKFIRWSQKQCRERKEFHLGIVLKETQKVIGGVGLKRIDYKHQCGEFGFWLGKKHWNQGLTSEAARLMLHFGFRQLRLHRIYAHAFDENIGSRRVLEKCGFQLEGIMRQAVIRNKKRHDLYNYGILRSEFLDNR